jgi:D-alanyl-D-alanine carboxypeptidase
MQQQLDGWVATAPPDTCVGVRAGGVPLYEHDVDVALVPASLQKLLIAAAALRVFDDEPTRARVAAMLPMSDRDIATALLAELGGLEVVRRELTAAGITLDGAVLADASGHARANRLSCRHVLDLLEHPEIGPVLLGSLAVAGETGRLADRFIGTPLAGNLRAKTGSLSDVIALAGGLSSRSGERLVFVVIANGGTPPVDEVPAVLYEHPIGVDLEGVGP